MAVLVVSEMELSRLDTLQRIIERRLTCTAAAKLLGLSRRQVHRLVKAYRAQGPGLAAVPPGTSLSWPSRDISIWL
jgi:Helix-turn-helix domain